LIGTATKTSELRGQPVSTRRGKEVTRSEFVRDEKGNNEMFLRVKHRLLVLAFILLWGGLPLLAQQKGQYVPGQWGLNAGAIPDPGFTYANLALNYSAGQLNDSNANAVPGITGTYAFWVDENVFYYVPKRKFLGGYFMPYVVLSVANGSLDASGPLERPQFGVNAGGVGFADMYVQPLNLGWHLKRADMNVGYGFTAPTGRYSSAPGTTNNVGSGYWGNDLTTNTTLYLTKNKGTSANLATIWEIHGQKQITNIVSGLPVNRTPGQAFTIEWGLGQVIPLKKDFSRLFQIGLIAYDQWQVSNNSGTTILGTPASALPYYSVHALGFQTNFIVPAKALNFFFKYYGEYHALARPQGRTIVFGGSWTLRIPKPAAPKS
jgi:hypothetical protein